jgi:hypothetical protein
LLSSPICLWPLAIVALAIAETLWADGPRRERPRNGVCRASWRCVRCGWSICCCFAERGTANWIGLLVVVQNIASSLLNSHLSDFVEGSMYVLGVGIAGGMSLSTRRRAGTLPGAQISVAPRA